MRNWSADVIWREIQVLDSQTWDSHLRRELDNEYWVMDTPVPCLLIHGWFSYTVCCQRLLHSWKAFLRSQWSKWNYGNCGIQDSWIDLSPGIQICMAGFLYYDHCISPNTVITMHFSATECSWINYKTKLCNLGKLGTIIVETLFL